MDEKKRRQLLLRLPEELVKILKEEARKEGIALVQFCRKYLELARYFGIQRNNGQIITRQTRRRVLMIPASQYDQMYGANATYREGRRLGLELAPLLNEFSVEDTLALFSVYGWGVFDFQAEQKRILLFNSPISSSEFIRGLIEGLTGLTLGTLTKDRDVFVYEIKI